MVLHILAPESFAMVLAVIQCDTGIRLPLVQRIIPRECSESIVLAQDMIGMLSKCRIGFLISALFHPMINFLP
jgi:hypothetical protein